MAATVPGYKLPALHKLLCKRGRFEGTGCFATSYWAVIRRCTATNENAAPHRLRGVRGTLDNMR
jgi:hypothetical protein